MKHSHSLVKRAPSHTPLRRAGTGSACSQNIRTLLSAVGLVCALAWARPAAAEVALGFEVNYSEAVDHFETGKGGGVDVRVGPRLELWRMQLTPELSAGMHDLGGFPSPTVLRGLVGGKVAFDLELGIKPTLFAHFGVGRLRYDAAEAVERDAATGMAGDLGASLDVNVLPMLDVGIQGSYNAVGIDLARARFEWIQVGGHVTVILDRSRS